MDGPRLDNPAGPTPEDGAALVALAIAAVAAKLRGADPTLEPPDSPYLRASGASFVTLERRGQLRGCIGTVEARRPLYLDVARNAVGAMADPRLPRVTVADWPELDVKVAVLTTPTPVPASDRAGVVAALCPGVDGLLLADGVQRATFLPAVWAKLPEPERFLDALLAKGGWREWSDGIRAYRYASVDFADRSPRGALA